jgi:hypothetical protein
LERAQVYADELARRQTISQGERMEALTKSLNRFIWWIVSLTSWTLFSGANARSAKSSNPKVHWIDPATLTGCVFGVEHEHTTDLSLLCSWVPDRNYANLGEHVFSTHSGA